MIIGYDKNKIELREGDICKFIVECPFEKKLIEMEGMISYDREYFAYEFDINEKVYPHYLSILMSKAEYGSIEKIINVDSTKINDEKYKFYQDIWNKK